MFLVFKNDCSMSRQKITRQTNHEKERDYDRKKYDYESKKEPETVYGKKIFLPVYSNLNNLSDPCCIFKYLFYGKCRSGKA